MREVGQALCDVLAAEAGVDDEDEHVRNDANARRSRDARKAGQPAMVAARAMLRMASGTDLSDLGSEPRFLILVVPDFSWANPMLEAFRLFVKGGRPACRGGGESRDEAGAWCALTPDSRRGSLSTDDTSKALLSGVQVVGATHDLSASRPLWWLLLIEW
jgi:hypothetical protein